MVAALAAPLRVDFSPAPMRAQTARRPFPSAACRWRSEPVTLFFGALNNLPVLLEGPSRPSEVALSKRVSPDRLFWDLCRLAVCAFSLLFQPWLHG